MRNMTAALPKASAKFALPALVFAGALGAMQAQSAAQSASGTMQESVTVAMRVNPSTTPNITVVPKTAAADRAIQNDARKDDVKTDDLDAFDLSAEMRDGIEDTVREQLTALVKGDANMAFANLAPETQRFFSEPQRFMRSVATDAPPVVKTKSFAFVGLEQDRGAAQQQVLLTDQDGRSWLAKFQVEQQLTGDWRVKSCVVEAAPGQQA
ncbi:hypothetical protein A7A08_00528 [Methyloligella halotolerans]|uniref:DUF4864 domain-containing protein n=1 Tax=Methyloligella halotolerans TaxID=1177755 RepID=A0A1E2S2F9_9HYPH|nr:DUF4864 domain-containing protein [Methyloligella halotolerans]ODA68696.1 hypothetical protein A7A08_00528 [Methyloligella halotolerans]